MDKIMDQTPNDYASYVKICKNMQNKYAIICKICQHDIYMQNVTAWAIPSVLWAAPGGASDIICSHER